MSDVRKDFLILLVVQSLVIFFGTRLEQEYSLRSGCLDTVSS